MWKIVTALDVRYRWKIGHFFFYPHPTHFTAFLITPTDIVYKLEQYSWLGTDLEYWDSCCYDFHGVVALTRVGFGEILRNFPGLGILAGLFWNFLWNNLYILAFAMMMTFHDIWYESGQEETQWSISVNNSHESPRWWSVINFYTKCTNTVQRQIRNQNNKKE